MPKVWISLGSNQNREANLCGAITALRGYYGNLYLSKVYESPAVGFDGPIFYNLVAGFTTSIPPAIINRTLHEIEEQFGRIRSINKFAPRTLDLDLLTWGNLVTNEAQLKLPRDEILRYAFVLKPLAEIAKDEQHPVLKQTYQQLWAAFDATVQPLWPVSLTC
ncbi:2-amino-4-hydroxy-6-hydroxymethyldihydropteridine pyrophosphokinase [Achromatium sp. WMS1]|nr:2-amino-4-hydroxy-6-hydroxymethyldihydropteridine pyrophosphokinase [Achromatium sp. WMS1]